MRIKLLIQMAVTLAILAASTGKLPLILKEVSKAQLVLLEESKASRWGQVYLLRDSIYAITAPFRVTQEIYLLPQCS